MTELAPGYCAELGRKCVDARAEIERLRAIEVAARAFEAVLSEYCDGPERDALRAALETERKE